MQFVGGRDDVEVEVLSEITEVETIAVGRSLRELPRLRRIYGPGRWRKMKGVATIRLWSGRICVGEIHWYEAHGVGRRELKLKRILRGRA
jgi:hypothetical protein